MAERLSPEFATALVKAQGAIEGAVKGSNNPAFRSKYADLGACWEACRDAFQNNNIAVLQFPSAASPGHIGLTTILLYGPTGETVAQAYELPLKDATSAQAAGSAITYARRYALCAVIGICPVDDDGNAASKAPKAAVQAEPTETQVSAAVIKRFSGLTDRDAMKAMYTQLKNSQVAEPAKTEVLTVWAKKIKETN